MGACGFGGGGGRSGDAAIARDADGLAAPVAKATATGGGSLTATNLAAQPATPDNRKVVRTAELTVRVDDTTAASERAEDIAEEAGGFVASEHADLDGDGPATLVLRVPPDAFERTLDELADLGRAVQRSTSSNDVTEEYVDVEGRIAALRASAERLRVLIGEGNTPTEIVAVEMELARREADLEALEARLRSLNSHVDLTTINLSLTERDEPEVSDDIPGFMAGLRGGWAALLNTGQVLATVAGAVLPFVPFVALAIWGLVRLVRRLTRQA